MKRSIQVLFIIGILTASCEKIIDINVPEKDRKIVFNSLINPDSTLAVNLSKSKSILEDNSIIILADGVVSVFEDDNFIGDMEYSEQGWYFLRGYKPNQGNKYRFEVDHSQLRPVSAEVSVPFEVPVIQLDTSRSFDEYGNDIYKMSISIDDPEGEENYYALSIVTTGRVYDWVNEEFLDSIQTYNTYFRLAGEGGNNPGSDFVEQKPSFTVDGKMFIMDAPFRTAGGRMELALEYYIYSSAPDSITVNVSLDHIDRSYYYYAASKEKYYQSGGNPFAEPVQVYSNIENGFGLMSAYARTTRNFEILAGGGR